MGHLLLDLFDARLRSFVRLQKILGRHQRSERISRESNEPKSIIENWLKNGAKNEEEAE